MTNFGCATNPGLQPIAAPVSAAIAVSGKALLCARRCLAPGSSERPLSGPPGLPFYAGVGSMD